MKIVHDQMQQIRDSMRAAAAGFLRPGETIDAVFGAMTYSVLKATVSDELGTRGNKYRIFAVTSGRILVLDAVDPTWKGVWGVVAELPRSTRLGPPAGLLWHVIPVGKEKLRVPRRFFKDIRAADAAMSASDLPGACDPERPTTKADHNNIRIRPIKTGQGSGGSPGERR